MAALSSQTQTTGVEDYRHVHVRGTSAFCEQTDLEPVSRLGENTPRETCPRIGREERGDERERDTGQTPSTGIVATAIRLQGVKARQEIAKEVIGSVESALTCHSKMAFAADIQLMKRQLSSAHAQLGRYPAESDYLSIVTLVETGLATAGWESLTRDQLRALRDALSLGMNDKAVTFDDYRRMTRRLRHYGLSSSPVFEPDLTVPPADDQTL